MGEQCRDSNGGSSKGPAVCPRSTSFCMALDTAAEYSAADLLLFGLVSENLPLKPISNPWVSPSKIYSTKGWLG